MKRNWKRTLGRGIVALIGVIVLFTAVFVAVIELTPMSLSQLTTSRNQTVVYDKNGNVYMKIGSGASTLTYNQIPKDLQNALVATEDHNFWTGGSIDVRSLLRSTLVDVVSHSASQGASTIQEQLAKIAYLNDNKTISYKIKEIVMGVKIDRYFTKQEILTMYLDRVFLGENSVGAEQAAMRYFGVNLATDPNSLTLDQAALLAGLPQAPSAYNPLQHPKAALARRNQVLENMAKYGYITKDVAAAAEAKPLGASYHGVPGDSWDSNPLFTNFLFDYAAKNGITAQQLLSGGLKVYTTIDPKVQQAVNTVFWSDNYNGDFPGPTKGTVVEGGAVFVDPKTGGILGAAGSRKQGYTEFGMDRTYSNSSPGSSIKPIIDYAPAIESGKWTPTSILDNEPQDFGDGYKPTNWEGNGPGKVTLQYGLQWSQNIASVWLLQQIGLKTGIRFAENDGIQFDPSDKTHLGVAIGGMKYGVNPMEMAQAYEAFDNNGVQQQTYLIDHIDNQEGQTVYQFQSSAKTVMAPSTARTMTGLMQDVVDYGTGTRAQVSGWGVAGKTGTVQYDPGLNSGDRNWIRTAWFDGYTPNMVGSIYIGYDKSDANHHMTMSPLDPSANAAQIFGDITRLAEQGVAPEQFDTGPFSATSGNANAAKGAALGIQGLAANWDSSTNSVKLTWQGTVQGAAGYTVTRTQVGGAGGTGGNGQGVGSAGGASGIGVTATLGQTTGNSFEDNGVLPGNVYTYVVQGIDGNGKPVGKSASVTYTVPGQTASGQTGAGQAGAGQSSSNVVGNTAGNGTGIGNGNGAGGNSAGNSNGTGAGSGYGAGSEAGSGNGLSGGSGSGTGGGSNNSAGSTGQGSGTGSGPGGTGTSGGTGTGPGGGGNTSGSSGSGSGGTSGGSGGGSGGASTGNATGN